MLTLVYHNIFCTDDDTAGTGGGKTILFDPPDNPTDQPKYGTLPNTKCAFWS